MYKTTLSLVAAATLVASLEANTLELDPIVISATKTEQSLKEVTSNTDIITEEELEEGHYASVIEALSTLGGIDITQSGGIGQQSSLFLRGFSSKYTLVLVDGIRVNDPTNFDGALFDQLNIADIERIEIIKGAQSGIWGADAVAGVINIITKKAQGSHTNAYVEAGSFNTKKFGATASHATKTGDIKIGFDRILTDGFSAAEPTKSSPLYGTRFDALGWERDGYTSTTIHAKAGLNLTDRDRVELSHRYVSSTVEFDDAGIDRPFPIVSSSWGDSYYTNSFTQRFSRVSYKHTEAQNTFEAYAGRSDFERSYYGGYYGKTDEIGITDTVKYASDSTLVLGAIWQKFNVDSAGGSTINNDYIGKGVFVSNTNLFDNGLTVLSETLRYDSYTAFDSKVTGKIGVKRMIGEGSIGANYGTAYLAPSLIQISNPYGAPNPDLKPENIRSFDVTGSYHNLSLTYFYNTIKDMIDWYDPDGWLGPLQAYYTNTAGTSTLQGYEAKIKQPIGKELIITSSYTRLHASDSSGKELARRPHDSLKGSADWYPSDKLHLNLNAIYIGTRYEPGYTVNTGNYAVFGGVVNYAVNPNLDLYLKLDNIFDRYYQTVDGYATAGRSGYIGIKVNY